MKYSDSLFYRGINYTKNPTEKPWFKASAMGVNKLNSLMKTIADEAGFDEKRRLTNQSARKTMIQKLNDNKSPSFPKAGPFSGAVLHGGQFNITINTVNKSSTSTDHSTQSTRSFKRIKRVFGSSDEDSPPGSDKLNFIGLPILDLPLSLFSNEQFHV